MTNGRIIDILETTASLLELHDENAFKIKALQSAVFNLDKQTALLSELSLEELEKLDGIGKSIAAKIFEISQSGTTQELEFYISSTPPGVIEMLQIKGIGAKKVRALWKELEVTTLDELMDACKQDKVSAIKGFGEKTQENVRKSIEFIISQRGRFMYADAEDFAFRLEEKIKEANIAKYVSLAGDIRRKMETVGLVQILLSTADWQKANSFLDQFAWLEKDEVNSAPFVWRGEDKILHIKAEIRIYPEEKFASQLYLYSAGKYHLLSEAKDGITMMDYVRRKTFVSEEEIFTSLEMDFILPEMREGFGETELARKHELPKLVELTDMKGILHNHSTYSDGKHTLEEMAMYCQELGYEYLGITDHSKTATYANGLQEFRIKKQHEEIDRLNEKLAPFKIFKGIESDILTDGSLDYTDEVLASFDFIVSSIHSGFNMDEEKATQRLVKAIENPYTTILGHPTGRLLLKREGYPINHKRVIDACAENNVVIEINANPWRLDMDWRWVHYALEKKVMIAINPDAHEKNGYHDMKYGMYVGRKAGLTKELTFNALSLEEMERWIVNKKTGVKSEK